MSAMSASQGRHVRVPLEDEEGIPAAAVVAVEGAPAVAIAVAVPMPMPLPVRRVPAAVEAVVAVHRPLPFRRVPLALVLVAFGLYMTVTFALQVGGVPSPLACDNPLFAEGIVAVMALWFLLFLGYRVLTTRVSFTTRERAWVMFAMLVTLCYGALGLDHSATEHTCQMQIEWTTYYSEHWVIPPQQALHDAHYTIVLVVVLLSTFPVSFGLAWCCLAIVGAPMVLTHALLSRTCTCPKLCARFSYLFYFGCMREPLPPPPPPPPPAVQGVAPARSAVRDDDGGMFTLLSDAEHAEMYPLPMRSGPYGLIMMVITLPVIFSCLLKLTDNWPGDQMHCDYNLYPMLWALVCAMIVLLPLLYTVHVVSTPVLKEHGFWVVLVTLTQWAAVVFACVQLTWNVNEYRCRSSDERSMYWPATTDTEVAIFMRHQAAAALLLFWSLAPILFPFAWFMLTTFVIAPAVCLFHICCSSQNEANGWCDVLLEVAACWWVATPASVTASATRTTAAAARRRRRAAAVVALQQQQQHRSHGFAAPYPPPTVQAVAMVAMPVAVAVPMEHDAAPAHAYAHVYAAVSPDDASAYAPHAPGGPPVYAHIMTPAPQSDEASVEGMPSLPPPPYAMAAGGGAAAPPSSSGVGVCGRCATPTVAFTDRFCRTCGTPIA